MEGVLSWLRNVLVTSALVVRQAGASLRANWGVGLLSLVLAISLWVYVTDRENPEQAGRVPGSVPIEVVNVPPGQALLSISEDAVTVRARAAESVLERLTADDFRAEVDLRAVTAQQATVEVDVESRESRATVDDVSPAQVVVTLENVTTRTVAVKPKLVGAPRRGFEQGEITVRPDTVEVSGPQSLVARVASVEADINLTPVSATFEQTVLLQARGEGGGNIEGVDVDPESAIVRVEIIQSEITVDFIVRPVISGLPAEGYNVTDIQADPPVVSLSGLPELLQNLDAVGGVPTASFSIDGATDDVIHSVPLQLPEGVRVDDPEVTVRVSIAPARGQYGFSVVPRVANLASGLSARLVPSTVQVVLSGDVPTLARVDPESIAVTLDAAGLGVGNHLLPVRVQPPSGTTVVSVAPVEVRVALTSP